MNVTDLLNTSDAVEDSIKSLDKVIDCISSCETEISLILLIKLIIQSINVIILKKKYHGNMFGLIKSIIPSFQIIKKNKPKDSLMR
jgi:hypothetical protein